MNKINLKFEDKSMTSLAGDEYGEKIYLDQVKNKIDLKQVNIIIFPEDIKRVAISFVQGFLKNIFKEIKKEEFYNYFKIEGSEKVISKFRESINL